MSDNELIEVPSMIGSLVHLEQLNISRNGLTSVLWCVEHISIFVD